MSEARGIEDNLDGYEVARDLQLVKRVQPEKQYGILVDPSVGARRQQAEVATVLVVEDHADLREMLATLLEGEGFHVETARNGAEALVCMKQTRPSVILLDLMMPVMSGDEFRQRQLQDPNYADVPVICMTAAHDGLQRAERLQATRYFQKPVDFDRLIHAVHQLAQHH